MHLANAPKFGNIFVGIVEVVVFDSEEGRASLVLHSLRDSADVICVDTSFTIDA